jgi:hypothetical protein
MSARAEIQEIVEWISDLTKKPAAVDPKPLPKETWQRIGQNLKEASETLEKARAALGREQRPALAEYARDLEGQAEALALRARLLAGRAKAELKPKPDSRPRTTAARKPSDESASTSAGRSRRRRAALRRSPTIARPISTRGRPRGRSRRPTRSSPPPVRPTRSPRRSLTTSTCSPS